MPAGNDFLTGAAYIRVSTDQQLELSPDSQLEEIKKYAKANQIILSADHIFMEEDGRSGRKSANRPQFQRMISLAKTEPRPFDVILVWKFSRFARNQEESIVYKSMLKSKCGVDVVSVSEPLADGPFGSLIERIIEWMDEYYSIRLAGEVRRGMREKALRGGVVGSPPYGYRVENGRFVPYEPEAAVVRMIFDEFYHGEKLQTLTRKLNQMGVRTKNGSLMENRTLRRILQNPAYIGKIQWSVEGKRDSTNHGEVICSEGGHEPLVTPELFQAVQEQLSQRSKMYPKYAHESPSGRAEYMLRGLVKCSNCGSTLVYQAGGLQCHSYAKGACQVSHYVRIASANERVIDLIEQAFSNMDFPLIIRNEHKAGDAGQFVLAQIQRERAKLDRLRAAYEDGIDTLEEYKANKRKVMATLKELEQQKPAPVADRDTLMKKFVKAHKTAIADLRNPNITESDKNVILRSFVDHIEFSRPKNQFTVYFYI